jgi:hypothetical protein
LRTGLYLLLTCLSLPSCARTGTLPIVENPTIRAQRGVNQMASGDLVVRPAPDPDSLPSNTAKDAATTGCILGGGVQAYGSNLRVGTLGYSERRVGVLRIAEIVDTRGCSR